MLPLSKTNWLGVYLLVWFVIILLFTFEMMIGRETGFVATFFHSMARWTAWIFLTPAVLWLATKFPLSWDKDIFTHIGIHLFLSILVASLAAFIFEVILKPDHRPPPNEIQNLSRPRPPMPNPSRHSLTSNRGPEPSPSFLMAAQSLNTGVPFYWALVGGQSAFLFASQLRRREREKLELQTKLTNAKLETLKLQLQPHFLLMR